MELRRSFPNLFNIASDKDCLVSSVLLLKEGRVSWNPIFHRNLQDWEMDASLQLFDKLYTQIVGSREDHVVLADLKSEKFSVKSYYFLRTQGDRFAFPWKIVWKSIAPSRVAWELAYEAILTGDNLRCRCKIYVD